MSNEEDSNDNFHSLEESDDSNHSVEFEDANGILHALRVVAPDHNEQQINLQSPSSSSSGSLPLDSDNNDGSSSLGTRMQRIARHSHDNIATTGSTGGSTIAPTRPGGRQPEPGTRISYSLGQVLSALTNGRLRIISPPPPPQVVSTNTSNGGNRLARRLRRPARSGSNATTNREANNETLAGGDRARSGMVAYFVAGDDDDDDDDDDDYVPLRAGRRTLADASPDGSKRRKDAARETLPMQILTDRINSSDFCLQLNSRFGRLGPMRHASLRSPSLTLQTARPRLPSLLAERECRALMPSEKLRLACQLLPDTKMRLAHINGQKFFGGIYSDSGDLFVSYSQDQYIRLFDTSQTTAQAHMIRSIRARDVGWSIIDVRIAPDCSNFVYSSWCDSIHMCSLRDINYTALDAQYDAEKVDQSGGRSSSIRNGSASRTRRRSVDVTHHQADHDIPQETLQLEPDYSMSFCVFSMSYSYDAREIIAGSSAGGIYVYDLFAGRRTLCINEAHDDDCNAVVFSRTSSDILFSAGDDGLIKIWDRRALMTDTRPKPVGTFAGHQNGCTFLDAHFDGRHLLSNSKDQTIKLWDCRRTASTDAIKETNAAVKSQAWDYRWARNTKQSSLREAAGMARALRNDCSLMTYAGAHTLLTTLIRARFSPQHITGGRYIYCGSGDDDVVIYDALTGKPVKLLMHHTELVRDVHWHPYRQEIVSSGWDGDHELWFHRPSSHSAQTVEEKKFENSRVCVYNDASEQENGIAEADDDVGDSPYVTRRSSSGRVMFPQRNANTAAQRLRDRREKVERLISMGVIDSDEL